MSAWIDNTGLHAAHAALRGDAGQSDDVLGLLQLGTLLVYCERIRLNGFESQAVRFRTEAAIHSLRSLGVDKQTLEISEETVGSYALACERAAEEAALDLEEAFQFGEEEPEPLGPMDIGERELAGREAISRIIDDSLSASELQELQLKSLRVGAAGAVQYMLATTALLRDSVRAVRDRDPERWNERGLSEINGFLRFYLNDALAIHSGLLYAPAIPRARVVDRKLRRIIDEIEGSFEHFVKELRGTSLGAPPVATTLVKRSKGYPEGVIDAVLQLRQKSGPLRTWIDGKVATLQGEPDCLATFHARQAAGELLTLTLETVGVLGTPKLTDALELKAVLGAPKPEIKGATLVKWAKRRWDRRKTAVLSEVVIESFSEWREHLAFRNLWDRCGCS